MAAMDTFVHILNWKLKRGSHAFPGKDGGTCINEAAIVAAGFAYRPVRAAEGEADIRTVVDTARLGPGTNAFNTILQTVSA